MKKLMMLCMILFTSLTQAADVAPQGDPMVYYRIGGGRPLHFSPSDPMTTLHLRFTAGVSGMSSMCQNFDPKATLDNGLNAVKNGVDDALVQMEAAATSAIAALPGLMLMKANPGLYETLQNALFRYQQKYDLATKQCESLLSEAEANQNPFDDWVTVSAAERWKAAAGSNGVDVYQVSQAIAKDPGAGGTTYINGEIYGCEGCPPIEPNKDIATAGAKMLTGKALDFPNHQSFGEDQPVTRIFEDADEIRDWIDQVLGDTKIGTCLECDRGALPGKGLTAHIEEEAETIQAKILEIMNHYNHEEKGPIRENLAAISAPNMMITRAVLDGIRQSPPMHRSIFIERLAIEVAQLRAIEKTLAVRRMLLTGLKEPNISALKNSEQEINKTLSKIKTELDQLIYERDVKTKFVGNTVENILTFQRQNQLAAGQDQKQQGYDKHQLINSRVESVTEE